MQMTIVFKSDVTTLSASVDVKDQNEARKIAGDLYAQTAKLQNGHTSELILKNWSANLTKAQAAQRMAKVSGMSLNKARELQKLVSAGQSPLLRKGDTDEIKDLELKLRDHGIYCAVKKVSA